MASSSTDTEFRDKIARAKDQLHRNVPAALKAMGLGFSTKGKYLFLDPPAAANSTSFWVNGDDGSWRDEMAGQGGGDLMALYAYVTRQSMGKGLAWAFDHLGWSRNGPAKPISDADMQRREAEAHAAKVKRDAEKAEKSRKMLGYWLGLKNNSTRLIEIYLREGRKIPLDRIGGVPEVLHFDPCAEHVDEDGVVTEWPCMVALYTRGSDMPGIHKTWLRPDGSAKAPVTPSKKMIGPISGSAIRLTRGEGGFRASEAIKRGVTCPLIIGEGIETSLTGGAAKPNCRAWAAGSLSLMRGFQWPSYASDIVLMAENNTHPQAIKAFEDVKAHWEAERLRMVEVAAAAGQVFRGRWYDWPAPAGGSDHNDFMMEA